MIFKAFRVNDIIKTQGWVERRSGHSMTNRLDRWKVAWERGESLQRGVLETRYKFILHMTVWAANLKCRSYLIIPLMAWQGVPLSPAMFTRISLGFKVVYDLVTSYPLFVPAHGPLPCFTFQQQKMIWAFPLLGNVILSSLSWNCLSSLITLPSSLSSNFQFIN